MIFKAIKFCILTIILLVAFVNLKSSICSETLKISSVPPKGYYNEADREENDVHHHYEYPESSWKQQHQTPKIIVDESLIALDIEKNQ